MNDKVRVRFAPSPTGPLHIGGVRTALYNYLFAKKHGGDFLLRIEDTDQSRFVEGAENYILDSLKWCGIEPNEGHSWGGDFGPYKQSERKDIYHLHIQKMIDEGTAYYAFDTPEELNELRVNHEKEKKTFSYDSSTRQSLCNSLNLSKEETASKITSGVPFVIRVKVPSDRKIVLKDIIRGEVSFDSSLIDDKVLFKSDGLPTYHFANVVDDFLMQITHVIRGEEWLPSAPLHVLLYDLLGWKKKMPSFAHLPLILKPNGPGKLSKRDGDKLGFPVFPLEWKDPNTNEVSMGYRENGYFNDAFINMLAFLGWNPGTEQELFSLKSLEKAFSLERVGKAGARFDPEKAKWFNEKYLRSKSNEELAQLLKPILSENNLSDANLAKVCDQMKERAVFVKDIFENGRYFFEAPKEYDPKTVKKKWKDDSYQIVEDMIVLFTETNDFSASTLEKVFHDYVTEKELGFGVAMIALRLVITGVGGGPSLFEIAEIIGKKECIDRMRKGVQSLQKEFSKTT